MRVNDRWNKRTHTGKAGKSITPVHRHKRITNSHRIANRDLCQYLTDRYVTSQSSTNGRMIGVTISDRAIILSVMELYEVIGRKA